MIVAGRDNGSAIGRKASMNHLIGVTFQSVKPAAIETAPDSSGVVRTGGHDHRSVGGKPSIESTAAVCPISASKAAGQTVQTRAGDPRSRSACRPSAKVLRRQRVRYGGETLEEDFPCTESHRRDALSSPAVANPGVRREKRTTFLMSPELVMWLPSGTIFRPGR